MGPRGPQTGRIAHRNRGTDRLKWTARECRSTEVSQGHWLRGRRSRRLGGGGKANSETATGRVGDGGNFSDSPHETETCSLPPYSRGWEKQGWVWLLCGHSGACASPGHQLLPGAARGAKGGPTLPGRPPAILSLGPGPPEERWNCGTPTPPLLTEWVRPRQDGETCTFPQTKGVHLKRHPQLH